MRIMLEKVGGKIQGACVPFFDGNGLSTGNNRLCFSPDGKTLWVGHSNHGWAGSRGIQKVTWTGKTPPDIHRMTLTQTGFSLTFTVPLEKASVTSEKNYFIKSYSYKYHVGYGSPQVNVKKTIPSKAVLSGDAKTVHLSIPNMEARRIYEISLQNLRTADGSALINPLVVYHAHNLRE
jgi:hypothetical protein